MKPWEPIFIDTNLVWGIANTELEFNKMQVTAGNDLMGCRQRECLTANSLKAFGFYSEYTGITLGEFLENNNV
jgi:hypothetical protein